MIITYKMKAIKTLAVLAAIGVTVQKDTYKYTCGSIGTKGTCAHYDSKADAVTLDSAACDYQKEYCDMDKLTETQDATCTTGSFSGMGIPDIRFLGEDCDEKDDKCQGLNVKCKDKKCTKTDDTKTCSDHTDCTVGTYCEGKKECKAQKAVGKACAAKEECINTAGCYDSKCTTYRSLSTGSTFKVADSDKNSAEACKSNFSIIKDGKATCVVPEYRKDNKADGSALSAAPECKKGEVCLGYLDATTAITYPCMETYGTTETNYCPDPSKILFFILFYYFRY